MKIGIIGLGRMGPNIARRLMKADHACVVHDANPAAGAALVQEGAVAVEAVPADVLAASLFVRSRSRQEHTFAEKVLSAMRLGFGGHVEAPKK